MGVGIMNRFLARAVLGVLLLGLFSCSSTTLTPLRSKTEVVDDPPLGELRAAEVGDTLIKYANLAYSPALLLKNDVKAKATGNYAGMHVTLKAGILVAKYADATSDCYMSNEPVPVTGLFSANGPGMVGGVCVDRQNPDRRRVLVILRNGANDFCNAVDPIEVEKTTYVDKSAPGFSQELIYNGKSSQNVKFLYREFTNEMARPAFNQEVQYDLNESHLIGFKGARLEVVDATNTNIKYKVVAHFPRPQ
jgi:hypothetical protein